jgi:hypothetical protein
MPSSALSDSSGTGAHITRLPSPLPAMIEKSRCSLQIDVTEGSYLES